MHVPHLFPPDWHQIQKQHSDFEIIDHNVLKDFDASDMPLTCYDHQNHNMITKLNKQI